MKVDTSKKCLVRGYFIYAQWRPGCISMEAAKDENNTQVGIAYTLWHRHDEDPKIVEQELDALVHFYSKFRACEGGMLGYEYKEYRR